MLRGRKVVSTSRFYFILMGSFCCMFQLGPNDTTHTHTHQVWSRHRQDNWPRNWSIRTKRDSLKSFFGLGESKWSNEGWEKCNFGKEKEKRQGRWTTTSYIGKDELSDWPSDRFWPLIAIDYSLSFSI